MTTIEWAQNPDGSRGKTWNPVIGCRRVSSGCLNCYAERFVHRGLVPAHRGLTVLRAGRPTWNGKFNEAPDRFDEPIRRRKPTTWFVNSLSDLFFEGFPFELVAALFGVMAATPQHRYIVLTKRPERARDFFKWYEGTSFAGASPLGAIYQAIEMLEGRGRAPGASAASMRRAALHVASLRAAARDLFEAWPLPNVDLLVSVENQETADERIPVLLQLPAAVRGVSYEPALGPVDFGMVSDHRGHEHEDRHGYPHPAICVTCSSEDREVEFVTAEGPRLDWIIVGGESGPGARPFDLAWARSTIAQCRAAGVPLFVKQLGAAPIAVPRDAGGYARTTITGEPWPTVPVRLRDRKGGDPSEWPEDLRVQEQPMVRR